MLRDGRFIKEPPPKIGAHYVPRFYRTVAESGGVMERETRWRSLYQKNLSSFEVGAWLFVMYVGLVVLFAGLRGLYSLFFE